MTSLCLRCEGECEREGCGDGFDGVLGLCMSGRGGRGGWILKCYQTTDRQKTKRESIKDWRKKQKSSSSVFIKNAEMKKKRKRTLDPPFESSGSARAFCLCLILFFLFANLLATPFFLFTAQSTSGFNALNLSPHISSSLASSVRKYSTICL